MNKINVVLLALCICFGFDLAAQKAKKNIMADLEKDRERYANVAQEIWKLAEVGYQEEKSSALLQSILKDEGFSIEAGVADMPTSFVASYGSGKPVIAILAEYDALPGMSQKATTEKAAVIPEAPGHACGHHLFGAGSVAAAVAVKNWMKQNGNSGTIRLYGCPAEEGGAGKVYMVRAGLFNDVDVALHWHPSSKNDVEPEAQSLSNKSAKFRFYGNASHAAASPENGRSALDGVEAMNMMVNMLREHVPQETRIHYVITKGGTAPNIVPDFAEVFYYVRNPEMKNVKSIFERVVKTAEGAALGTGTRMEYEVIHGLYNMLPNRTLSEVMYENLNTVGGVEYSETEKAFAQKIIASYDGTDKPEDASKIEPFVQASGNSGSTDVGDVSWMVPTVGLGAATWVPGTSAHSWQAVAAGGTSIGAKGMMVAAKTLALTAVDLFQNQKLIDAAKQEFIQQRGEDFVYESLLGDREPPLDYRK